MCQGLFASIHERARGSPTHPLCANIRSKDRQLVTLDVFWLPVLSSPTTEPLAALMKADGYCVFKNIWCFSFYPLLVHACIWQLRETKIYFVCVRGREGEAILVY